MNVGLRNSLFPVLIQVILFPMASRVFSIEKKGI